MFHFQKLEVVACYNRTQCGLRFFSQGTGRSKSFNIEYYEVVMTKDMRMADIPGKIRSVVQRLICVYNYSDTKINISMLPSLAGTGPFPPLFEEWMLGARKR